MSSNVDRNDSIAGAIYGMAFGDSWGFPTEFMRHGQILHLAPSPPRPLQVTDDTQMSLYNIQALREIFEAEEDLSELLTDSRQQIRVRKSFAERHLDFEVDEDNDRAPGNTVMGALYIYRRSFRKTGLEGSAPNDSKGCGTVMRAPWIGMIPQSRETVIALAILQSETTHGHPQAALSSAIAALVLREIFRNELVLEGSTPRERLNSMLYRALELTTEVAELNSGLVSSERFQEGVEGFRETVHEILLTLESVAEETLMDPDENICQWFGEGWVADQALLCALASFALHGEDGYGGIQRLVYSSGDSDSIAAIGGAFIGAGLGYGAIEAQAFEHGAKLMGSFEPRYEAELLDAREFIEAL